MKTKKVEKPLKDVESVDSSSVVVWVSRSVITSSSLRLRKEAELLVETIRVNFLFSSPVNEIDSANDMSNCLKELFAEQTKERETERKRDLRKRRREEAKRNGNLRDRRKPEIRFQETASWKWLETVRK